MLGPSPLRWIIYDQEKANLSFEKILESGDRFLDWVKEEDPTISSKCKTRVAGVDTQMNNERKLLKVPKRVMRCGHGGHTEVSFSALSRPYSSLL